MRSEDEGEGGWRYLEKAVREIKRLEDERDHLSAEVERLREVLRPFAERAARINHGYGSGGVYGDDTLWDVPLRDLRAALRVLGAVEDRTHEHEWLVPVNERHRGMDAAACRTCPARWTDTPEAVARRRLLGELVEDGTQQGADD